MTGTGLGTFFSPKGVAVIGASSDPRKLGFRLTTNLLDCGYTGSVHLVNARGGSFRGQAMHGSIDEVPDPVDLAVLLIPAHAVPDTLRDCALRGIRHVIISSAGFGETGDEGLRLERHCLEVAHEHGLRVIGPNCVGIIDTHFPVNTTFLNSGEPPRGNVAFVSHSGAMCAAAIDWSHDAGFGWSRVVSLGNQLDVTETDMLTIVGDDPETSAVALYVEGVRDGRMLVRELERLSRLKPVVALKVGRSEVGQRAVASHTGALAGADAVFDAAFRKAGVVRAIETAELFEMAHALASSVLPRGDRVAILTNAGGPGVAATDAVVRQGLHLASLSPQTIHALGELLPRAATTANPVDMLASASADHYRRALELLVSDDEVDSILVILPPPPHFPADAAIDRMGPVLTGSDKPVVVTLMGGPGVRKASQKLYALGIPSYTFPEQAARALWALHRRQQLLGEIDPDREDPLEQLDLGGLVAGIPDETGFVRPDIAADIAAACGIPMAPTIFGEDPEGVALIAGRLDFPVAVKVASSRVVHKTDVGGVRLGVPSPTDIVSAGEHLLDEVQDAVPDAVLEGLVVQPMQAAGIDVVVGAVRDPQFGPVVMFGSGGVEVELERDVVFALAPVSREEALRMIQLTRVGNRIRHPRGPVHYQVEAVADAIYRTSALISQVDEIDEFEINPLRVFDDGSGAVAIDVRCRTG
jgi:acetyltransferase